MPFCARLNTVMPSPSWFSWSRSCASSSLLGCARRRATIGLSTFHIPRLGSSASASHGVRRRTPACTSNSGRVTDPFRAVMQHALSSPQCSAADGGETLGTDAEAVFVLVIDKTWSIRSLASVESADSRDLPVLWPGGRSPHIVQRGVTLAHSTECIPRICADSPYDAPPQTTAPKIAHHKCSCELLQRAARIPCTIRGKKCISDAARTGARRFIQISPPHPRPLEWNAMKLIPRHQPFKLYDVRSRRGYRCSGIRSLRCKVGRQRGHTELIGARIPLGIPTEDQDRTCR